MHDQATLPIHVHTQQPLRKYSDMSPELKESNQILPSYLSKFVPSLDSRIVLHDVYIVRDGGGSRQLITCLMVALVQYAPVFCDNNKDALVIYLEGLMYLQMKGNVLAFLPEVTGFP